MQELIKKKFYSGVYGGFKTTTFTISNENMNNIMKIDSGLLSKDVTTTIESEPY